MLKTVIKTLTLTSLIIGLAGCVVYEPAPGPYAYAPPAYYGPPVYGSVVIGGGGWHHRW